MGTMTSQSSRLVVTLSTSTTKGSTQGRAGECKMPAEAVTSVAALLNVVLRVTAAVQKCVQWHSCCQRKGRVRREISPTARWFWQLSYLISMHHITREEELGCKHLNQSSTTNHDETTRPQCCTAAALPPCLGVTLSHILSLELQLVFHAMLSWPCVPGRCCCMPWRRGTSALGHPQAKRTCDYLLLSER